MDALSVAQHSLNAAALRYFLSVLLLQPPPKQPPEPVGLVSARELVAPRQEMSSQELAAAGEARRQQLAVIVAPEAALLVKVRAQPRVTPTSRLPSPPF
jgi:hypothetical protein